MALVNSTGTTFVAQALSNRSLHDNVLDDINGPLCSALSNVLTNHNTFLQTVSGGFQAGLISLSSVNNTLSGVLFPSISVTKNIAVGRAKGQSIFAQTVTC